MAHPDPVAPVASAAQMFDSTAVILLVATLLVFFVPVLIIFPPLPVEQADILQQTHSKLGARKANHLRGGQPPVARDSASLASQGGAGPAVIGSLHIYPLKSCREIELDRSKVVPSGLEYDRIYTFARRRPNRQTPADSSAKSLSGKEHASGGTDGKTAGDHDTGPWEFLSQRELPLLATIDVDIWLPDPEKRLRALGRPDGGFVHVRFPRVENSWPKALLASATAKMSRGWRAQPQHEFLLPLDFPPEAEVARRGYEYAQVKIWRDVAWGLDMSAELPPQLRDYVGVKPGDRFGLLRADPERQRGVFRCAPRKDTIGYQPVVGFQDAYPIHLLNLASVRHLESLLQKDEQLQELDPRRFRANITVSGVDEYDEETWRSIEICDPASGANASSTFDVSCRTVRCKMPNVDQDTGSRHRVEPDNSLRKHRNVDSGAPKNGCLGMQLCPMFPDTASADHLELHVEAGMSVKVTARGEHSYIGLDM